MTCLHRHGISKGASIDQNSVNAVLLDVDGSSFDQLLVAAQVNVNASGDRLSLRRFVLCPLFTLFQMKFSPIQHQLASSETWDWCSCNFDIFAQGRDQVLADRIKFFHVLNTLHLQDQQGSQQAHWSVDRSRACPIWQRAPRQVESGRED